MESVDKIMTILISILVLLFYGSYYISITEHKELQQEIELLKEQNVNLKQKVINHYDHNQRMREIFNICDTCEFKIK